MAYCHTGKRLTPKWKDNTETHLTVTAYIEKTILTKKPHKTLYFETSSNHPPFLKRNQY